QIKQEAIQIGFSHVGICRVEPNEMVPHLQEWLSRSYHGEMKYMENPKRGVAPEGKRSMVVVGLNYRWHEEAEDEPIISKYAWSQDYHRVMQPMLEELSARIQNLMPSCNPKSYVDTGPIAEKYWAQKAGVGWIGKHTNVISQRGSSWMFLGEILIDVDLETDD